MFYSQSYDKDLRFGDIIEIKGLISATPVYNDILKISDINDRAINIKWHRYCAVVMPCCSIGDSTLMLTPLLQLKKDFFKNSYYLDDFTNVNRRMDGVQAISDEDWGELSPEEQRDLLNTEYEYALLNYFIYESHPLLQTYKINIQLPGQTERIEQEIGHYMIDFQKIFRIKSDRIRQDKINSNNLGDLKLLEMTVQSRKEFREKLSFYFRRPATEDFTESEALNSML